MKQSQFQTKLGTKLGIKDVHFVEYFWKLKMQDVSVVKQF